MTAESQKTQPGASGASTTVIAAGTRVEGEVGGSASVVVEGVVEGRIHLENEVAIGAEGLVTGEINAASVRVAGTVKGNIHGVEMIEILASGSVEGDVRSPRVVINSGAFFKGRVEMGVQE